LDFTMLKLKKNDDNLVVEELKFLINDINDHPKLESKNEVINLSNTNDKTSKVLISNIDIDKDGNDGNNKLDEKERVRDKISGKQNIDESDSESDVDVVDVESDVERITMRPEFLEKLIEEQCKDELINDIYCYLSHGVLPEFS